MDATVCIDVRSNKLSTQEIVNRIRIPGDLSWSMGDRRSNSQMVQKTNGWRIYDRFRDHSDVGEVIETFLKRVAGREASFGALAMDCQVTVRCVVYCKAYPGLVASRHLLHALASMNATFGYDFYARDH